MPNEEEHATDRDDQDWLDALAGKPALKANTNTRQNAQRLRVALLQRDLHSKPTTPTDFHKLRSRLKAEGLIKKHYMQMLFDWLEIHLRPVMTVTAVVFVSVSLMFLLLEPEPMIPKSDIQPITLPILVEHPQQAAQKLQAHLLNLQQHAEVSQQQNYWQVTVNLSSQASNLENIINILSDYGMVILGADETLISVQFYPPNSSYIYSYESIEPLQEAEQIQLELQQAGTQVQRQQANDIVQLHIQIPLPLTEDMLSLLDTYGWDALAVENFEGRIQLNIHP